jgi:glucuronoarabinoxylan endo-1,4-beta-xylanase
MTPNESTVITYHLTTRRTANLAVLACLGLFVACTSNGSKQGATGATDGFGGSSTVRGTTSIGGVPTGNSMTNSGGTVSTHDASALSGGSDAGEQPGMTPTLESDVTITVDTGTRYQIIVGFGGSAVYYVSNVVNRTIADDDIYRALFSDLGLDILRIGNWYQNETETGTSETTPFSDVDAVTLVKHATKDLGHAPKILMSSWSPPAYLKSNGDTNNGDTLVDSAGAYHYAEFGQWWLKTLAEYASRGVEPDFIGIQNEPDWSASYQSCLFDTDEGLHAGYPQALDAVHGAIAASSLHLKPAIWGPEPVGIGYDRVETYLATLDLGNLDGIAHHLYHGGGPGDRPPAESFDASMRNVASAAATAGKPLFMTEYSGSPSMVETALMIHESLVVEGVSAYIYWPLFWGVESATPTSLLTVEDPAAPYTTAKGYTINDNYYSLKHYAKWVESGWVRVEATSTVTAVKVSAFASPDGKQLSVVLINSDEVAHNVDVSTGTFVPAGAFRTSGAIERTAALTLGSNNVIAMPAKSLGTLAFAK